MEKLYPVIAVGVPPRSRNANHNKIKRLKFSMTSQIFLVTPFSHNWGCLVEAQNWSSLLQTALMSLRFLFRDVGISLKNRSYMVVEENPGTCTLTSNFLAEQKPPFSYNKNHRHWVPRFCKSPYDPLCWDMWTHNFSVAFAAKPWPISDSLPKTVLCYLRLRLIWYR